MHIPRRCYIGETGKKRLIEHKEEETERTISWYMSRTTWWIAWEAAQVIERDRYNWKGRVLDTIHRAKHGNAMNLDCGRILDPVWFPFLSN